MALPNVEPRIERIEYSVNDGAGLGAHAEVRFVYGPALRCKFDAPPIGSRSDFHSTPRYSGYRPLTKIYTRAADGASFRTVREIELTYKDTTAMCAGQEPPKRLLTSIQETAYAPDGTPTTLPAITFDYGGIPTVAGIPNQVTGLAGARLLPTGKRWDYPFDATTETHRLMDINGDGRPDWVEGGQFDSSFYCQLRWRPNLGRNASGDLAFGSEQIIDLPTWFWDDGGPPARDQNCTLSGQYTRAYSDPPPGEDPVDQHWILYDFRDFDGDGFVDLLTGLSSNATIVQELPPGFSGSFHTGCTYLTSLRGDDGGISSAWDNDGDGPYPHVKLREPYRHQGCSTWRIHRNVANAGGSGRTFEHTWSVGVPPAIHTGERGRIPDDANSRGTPQAVVDIDGDGYLDFLEVTEPSDPQGDDWNWRWWRFDPQAGDVGNIRQWLWGFPGGQPSATVFPSVQRNDPHPDEDPFHYYPRSITELRDVTGDGLPDWISGGTLRVNTGSGFNHELGISVIGVPPEELSRSETHVLGNDGNIDVIADRTLHLRPIDLDKDGVTDYVDHRDGTVYWGAGHGVVHPSDPPLGEFVGGIEQRTRNQFGLWKVTQDQIDVDGDGLADKVMIDSFSDVASIWFMEPTGNAPPAVLRQVDNGRGLTLDVSYAPHTDPAVVTMGDGDLPGSTWVVESMTAVHAHGNVAPATTTYRYDTPVRTEDNFGRRGFRGFDEVTVTGPSGAKTVSRYGYDVDWSGRLVSSLAYQSGSPDPATIEDIEWGSGSLLSGEVEVVIERVRSSYQCEEWSGQAALTLSEASCRSQVTPLSTARVYGVLLMPSVPAYMPYALVVTAIRRGEVTGPSSYTGYSDETGYPSVTT
jgi:hypothetical protein